jgi:hypothetical protein
MAAAGCHDRSNNQSCALPQAARMQKNKHMKSS